MKITNTVRRLSTALLLTLAFAATSASAVPVLFNYVGACDTDCGLLGLNAGDAISGFLETDDAGIADNNINAGEIFGYGFQFGNVAFNTMNSFVDLANLNLNAQRSGFLSGQLRLVDPGDTNVAVIFEFLDDWTVYITVNDTATGSGEFVRVPEPGTLALLAIGLIAGVGFNRARKQS